MINMTFCKIEQSLVLYALEGVGLRLQMMKLHLKCLSAGQLVTRALLHACGAEALPGCKCWSLTMRQLSPASDVQLLGNSKIALLNFTLISTTWCSLAHNVQARRILIFASSFKYIVLLKLTNYFFLFSGLNLQTKKDFLNTQKTTDSIVPE